MDTSHSLTVLSSEAVARRRESEEKATSEMPCSWPLNCWWREKGGSSEVEEEREWMMAVLSAEEVARKRPSEENLREEIARLWGVRVCLRVYGMKD